MTQSGAQLLVKCMEALEVKYIFGIPGAKIDAVFDALVDSPIQLILCRHEQNACFMAAAHGRLTGEPGVVLVTSGPGVGNMLTGLLTATTEGDPVVAIGGNVSRRMLHKASHQAAQNVKLMEGATKSSQEVYTADEIPEAIVNAFRIAKAPRRGACFLSLPVDVSHEQTSSEIIKVGEIDYSGLAAKAILARAADIITKAKAPVLLLGEEASQPATAKAIHDLLTAHKLPVVSTFQAAGVVCKEYLDLFFGRVGLFNNQPGDKILRQADVVISIGYDPVEYDPEIWNNGDRKHIIHVDHIMSDVHLAYQTDVEVLGGVAENIRALIPLLSGLPPMDQHKPVRTEYQDYLYNPKSLVDCKGKIHPLRFIHQLHEYLDENTIVACDIGTHGMWMSRYFLSHVPHQLLISNGQQTLGVALPWAMAAKLTHPEKTVLATVGDGGFLFSATELETAVRENLHFILFVWDSGGYDMVMEQQLMKYKRRSGVDLGYYDVVKFAEAFGAKGYRLDDSTKFDVIMKQALADEGPVLIHMPVDYSDNLELFLATDPNAGH
ncbi:MAG: acetolactate synthase AlsS [Sneathiella sp.]|nr:acetolactate synthase AlsS [Sneathiella sp.]